MDSKLPNRYGWAIPIAIVIVGNYVITVPSNAQDSGSDPFIISDRQKLESFVLEDVRISLDLLNLYRRDEVESKNGTKIIDEEYLFRQTLELDTDAYIGHPNLIDLSLSSKFRLSEEELNSDTLGKNGQTLETIIDYDVNALVLKMTDIPISLYSSRNQSLFDRQFGGTLENIEWKHGASVSFRNLTTPTTLSYTHRDLEQTDGFGDVSFELVQDVFAANGQILPGGTHFIVWDYTFELVDESGQLRRTNSFQRQDGYINHTFDFGPENQHDLRSALQLHKEDGSFEIDRLRWTESLRLKHSDKFETRYDYTLDSQQRPESDQLLNNIDVSFRHELYESLVTTGGVGFSRLEIDRNDFVSEQQSANIGMNYTKLAPYGQLNATATYNYNRQDYSGGGATLSVVDESHSFGLSNVITINQRNVVTNSIVITDAAGIILYTEGVDYSVRGFGERTEIRRIFGGNISSGQTILIDYQIGPDPANTTTTNTLNLSARYTIDEGLLTGTSFYVHYLDQDQDRSSDIFFSQPAIDATAITFGMEYINGGIDLLAEHKIRDSTISPFKTTRLEARYSNQVGSTSSFQLSALYNEINNTDSDQKNTVTTFSGRWNERISDKLTAGLTLIWIDQSDSSGEDSQGLEQEFSLDWNYRQTSIYAAIRNSLVDTSADDSIFLSFALGIRREF